MEYKIKLPFTKKEWIFSFVAESDIAYKLRLLQWSNAQTVEDKLARIEQNLRDYSRRVEGRLNNILNFLTKNDDLDDAEMQAKIKEFKDRISKIKRVEVKEGK